MLFNIKGEKINREINKNHSKSVYYLIFLSFEYFFVSLHTDYNCSIVVEDEFFLDFK